MKRKKSASILRKFLLFNLLVFCILGLFTLLYLKAIQPNLVKQRTFDHLIVIKNTSDHINRLNIDFTKESMTKFLLSTRFLFQNLDRVQFYDLDSNLLADTDTLDLVKNAFIRSENVQETSIDKSNDMIDLSEDLKKNKTSSFNTESYVTDYSKKKILMKN